MCIIDGDFFSYPFDYVTTGTRRTSAPLRPIATLSVRSKPQSSFVSTFVWFNEIIPYIIGIWTVVQLLSQRNFFLPEEFKKLVFAFLASDTNTFKIYSWSNAQL
jgi:hypothetical protein